MSNNCNRLKWFSYGSGPTVLLGYSLRRNNTRDAGSDDAAAFSRAITGDKYARDVCLKILVSGKVRVEKFNLRCVHESGGMENAGSDLVKFFE